MLVTLKQDVMQGGQIKVSVRKPPRETVAWFAGTVIDMSTESAKKYIDAGLAEPASPGDAGGGEA